jgi:hypothetical protein
MFGVASAFVVAGPGTCLVSTAPPRPAQHVVDGVDGVDDQLGEQTTDLVDTQRNHRLGGITRWRVVGVFVGGDHGQDGVGEHDQGGMPVPGVPTADLMLVQAQALAGLKAGLDRPADTSNPYQGTQRHRRR